MTDLVQEARELGPSIAERSERIEADRTLPGDVVDDLRSAGLFRFFVPAELGGPEVDVATGMATIAEVARHDGGSAWCVMIAGTTSLLAGFLPPDHAATIYGPADSCTGGYSVPTGTARPVDGGLVVSGSGSTDYATREAFVPEGRWVQLVGAKPRLDGPLWRFPFYGMLATGVAAVAIGLLDGAIDRFAEIAEAKTPQGSGRTLAERASGQTAISTAEATARSARAFLEDALGVAWETASAGDPLSIEHRRVIRLAAADAAQRCADALINLQRQAGGTAVYLREPLQRAVRDGQVAATHGMVAERIHELTGRIRLGLDTDTRLL